MNQNGRPPKKGKIINVKVRTEIYDTLAHYSEDTGVLKTRVVEFALQEYLTKKRL